MNKNLNQSVVELRQALLNFGGAVQSIDLDVMDSFRARGAYNDMITWFNYYVSHADTSIKKLESVDIDMDEPEFEKEVAKEIYAGV